MKRKMGFSFSSSSSFTVIALGLLLFITGTCYAHNSNTLSTHFYSKSCPKVFSSVKSVVRSAVAKEPRMGASLLRLHFHDCFVHGCDGSLLLDGPNTEKTALPNNNSVRGFEVVDAIKSKVEKACPGIVSCADILTIAARDSVKILGGPSWDVKLGRRDSRRAFLNEANSGVIPPPSSTLSNLINRFRARGLSTKDMVALSGAHTIGKARCTIFRNRIYNETNIDPKFAKIRQKTCPRTAGSGDDNLAPFDIQTPNCFDNLYYQNLINKKGLLRSDQILFNGTGTTDSLVKTYYNDQERFFCDFIEAMIKMGDIRPLTGSRGEIRRNCRMPN